MCGGSGADIAAVSLDGRGDTVAPRCDIFVVFFVFFCRTEQEQGKVAIWRAFISQWLPE